MGEARILESEENPDNYARVTTYVSGEKEELVLESVKGYWTYYYKNISEVLNDGADLIVTPEQMLPLMKVYDAAMESSETGQAVSL